MSLQTAAIDTHQLAGDVKRRARSLGFDLVGIADASPSKYQSIFRQWLDQGQHGTMQYLDRRFEERTNPAIYLPGARSVVCVAVNYHFPLDSLPSSQAQDHVKVARYALGDDYHEVIKPRL